MLACLTQALSHNKNLLERLAEALWCPLMEIYKECPEVEIRIQAVSLLGDVCAVNRSPHCIKVLE